MLSVGIYDDNLGNNVVSLENFEDINDNYLLRAPKKGKIIKGPNWTAYKRENLGTIPRKTEKVLIEDKINQAPLGFSSQTGRFSGRSQSIKYGYPGPGSYNYGESNSASTSLSSKGYCNGFVSVSERFDDSKYFYEKYYPGPGQYKLDDKISINNHLNKNIKYKSLYDKTTIKSLKIKQEHPGPGYYNPILLTNQEMNTPLSTFYSKVSRFKKDHKSSIPGPGKYFKEKPIEKEMQKGHTLSYFFKQPIPKPENLIQKYIDEQNGEPNFKLKQNINDGKIYISKVFTPDNNNINKPNDELRKTSQFDKFNLQINFQKIKNKKDMLLTLKNQQRMGLTSNKINFKRNLSAQPLYNMKKKDNTLIVQKSQDQQELQFINEVLGRNKKKPLFELSPPRWKDQISTHIPGPAYYNPKDIPKKLDFFNKEEARWI